MKIISALIPLLALGLCAAAPAASTGAAFYGDAPDEHHPWAVHDQNRPQPKLVTPGTFSSPEQPGRSPADAVVLFDGTAAALANWEADKPEKNVPTRWIVKDGALECVPKSGYVRSRASIGDCQLHVEWAAPTLPQGESQGRGNSGVFLMGILEVQVLDNYDNPTYADGFAGSVYGVQPPLANALRAPGQWQVYDIVFRRPIYRQGAVVDPGYVTVFLNGVLVQDHTPLEGATGHMKRTKPGPFPEAGPLKLQDHGNPVRYRNIWYRALPPRAIEGGTDGCLTTEATLTKRREIAVAVRADATRRDPAHPRSELLKLMEALVYEQDAATLQQVEQMAGAYAAALRQLPANQLDSKKDEVKHVHSAFNYLARFKCIPDSFGPKVELKKIVDEQGWEKKR
ncbi:MAG: DUF1080 domain-containing protein [Kiritimatiellaeota bacterium]|nr:DUF1080 domain-containing protein [Kiritimatiellota bacterium]